MEKSENVDNNSREHQKPENVGVCLFPFAPSHKSTSARVLEVKSLTRRFKPLRKLLKVDASENISQKGMVIHLKASYRVGRSIAADWKAVISEAVSILHRIVMLKIPQLLQSSEKNTIYNFTPEVHAYQPSDEAAAGEVFLR